MNQIFLPAAAVFLLALMLDILIIRRGRPGTGYLIGLLPILVYAGWFLYPLLTCHSENPVGCEWSGFGILLVGGLTLAMLILYSFLAAAVARASQAEGQPSTTMVILLLLVCAIAGGVMAKIVHDLARTGVFVQWQSLTTPPDLSPLPGERAVKFRMADLHRVQITTNRERIFQTDLQGCAERLKTNSNCWFYGSEDIPPVLPPNPGCLTGFQVKEAPGPAIARIDATDCSPAHSIQTSYMLLADGSVWAWHHEVYQEFLLLLARDLAPGVLAGLILGTLLNRQIHRRRRASKGNSAAAETSC